MKVTDYIVEFLQRKGIHDFFGYQGTTRSPNERLCEKNPHTRSHSAISEQGALCKDGVDMPMVLRACAGGTQYPACWRT